MVIDAKNPLSLNKLPERQQNIIKILRRNDSQSTHLGMIGYFHVCMTNWRTCSKWTWRLRWCCWRRSINNKKGVFRFTSKTGPSVSPPFCHVRNSNAFSRISHYNFGIFVYWIEVISVGRTATRCSFNASNCPTRIVVILWIGATFADTVESTL